MKKAIMILIALLMFIPYAVCAADSETIKYPIKKGDSGEYIVRIQQRLLDLGYIHFRATGKYGDMTTTGVSNFQLRNGLSSDGMIGESTYNKLFLANTKRNVANSAIPRVVGPARTKTPEDYGALTEWKTINDQFKVGDTVKAIDFNTRKEFNITRTGGTNHADIQPADAAALKIFKTCYGGSYTWEKRSMLIEINGARVAASMFGMPNASGDKTGCGMDGSVCLYFYGSKSDIGGLADEEHNQSIQNAAIAQ